MASLLLTKLLFVHFVADYLLQFGFLAEGKERHGLRSWHVWVHIALHGITVHLVLQTWWITLVTLVTHGMIDACKISFQGKTWKRTWFFADQALHLAVIAIIWWLGRGDTFPTLPEWLESNLVLITALMVMTKPAKYMVGVYLTGWTSDSMPGNLPFCGKGPVMGMIERVATVGLVASGWWMAALGAGVIKTGSLFIGPFRNEDAAGRRFDLVGTLVSLGVAWVAAWLILHFGQVAV